ncbi:MAG TPA: InlB B-repeat-containing protein, partial [Spirochaetota bacterium]|nr:InlB B-repeat-containing protein [Spirochaetota bacterium]
MKSAICCFSLFLVVVCVSCSSLEDAYFEYQIRIDAPQVEGCSVVANPVRSVKGKTISLVVTPAVGMALVPDSLRVDDGSVSLTGDGPYSFSMPARDVTVSARFLYLTYPLTYILEGGTNHTANPAMYTITNLPFEPKAPGRPGYVFGGWFADQGLSERISSLTQDALGARTLYAKWIEHIQPVSFSGLSANGTPGSVTTTELTLTFDVEPVGLDIDDITVTGATKGSLSGTGTTRTLTISGVTVGNGGTVTV